MADLADLATETEDVHLRLAEQRARAGVYTIPPGEPGVCDDCGEEFSRLVNGLCGRCRDFRGV